MRYFIIAYVASKKEVTWSQLKGAIELWAGPVNPNTLSFHLGELMEGGFIVKIEIEGQPRYRVAEGSLKGVEGLLDKEIIKEMEAL
ncbi:MAG: hypothetical protein H5T34_00270 [Candidatus Methanomethyliales bacterium]|nr:hypothetical protein [Candidatus Methanomethylicales archaeon]